MDSRDFYEMEESGLVYDMGLGIKGEERRKEHSGRFFFFSSLSGFVCLCFLFSFLLFFNLPITFCSVSFCPFYLKIINKLFILNYLILDL